MASLRLKFPEKDKPSVVVISGPRVTIGRLPLNTIQVIDRTLSGFHAEFVQEDDHYRLHDRGSTNGTHVNGETITDFHLREDCKIAFGVLECEFTIETPATADDATIEALPTRSEVNGVRQENAELKNRVDSLREEIETLNKARAAESGSGTIAVAKDEYEKLVAERETLKEAQQRLQQDVERLKTDLSLLQRDRETLKQVADNARAELEGFRATPAAPEKPATPAAAEKPAAPEVSENLAPPAKPVPVATPAQAEAVPAAGVTPGLLSKPTIPLPSRPLGKPPASFPVSPAKVPAPTGSGLRPITTPKPTLGSLPLKPVATAPASAPAGKGGTQKIAGDAPTQIKPPTAVPKPPMKLPSKPIAKPAGGSVLPGAKSPSSTENAAG